MLGFNVKNNDDSSDDPFFNRRRSMFNSPLSILEKANKDEILRDKILKYFPQLKGFVKVNSLVFTDVNKFIEEFKK